MIAFSVRPHFSIVNFTKDGLFIMQSRLLSLGITVKLNEKFFSKRGEMRC